MRPLGIAPLEINFVGKIDASSADVVARSLSEYPGHHVEMLVDCEGGDWAAALTIFGLLRGHQRRVTAHIQRAASAGALIVMAADHRVLSPTGHFWLHMPVANTPGTVDQKQINEVAATKATLMASGCRVPAEQFLRWMQATTTINAKRALNVGLVHAVPGLTKHPVVFL